MQQNIYLNTGSFKKNFETIIENETLSFYFASACVMLLPAYVWYIPPFIILWVCSRIIEIRRNKNIKPTSFNLTILLVYLFVSFYVWQIVGLSYSENIKTGWNIIFSRLSLILFPIILIFPGEKILKNIRVLLNLFSFSTAIFILICFIHAFYISTSFQNGELVFNPHPPDGYWMSYFTGTYFAINQHPSYLAIYVVISALYAFESGFYKVDSPKIKYLWFTMGIYLIISLYFLSSRAGILCGVLIIPLYFLYRLRKNIISIILILTLLFFVLIPILSTNVRIKIFTEEISSGAFKETVKNDGRLNVWKSAIRIINRNSIVGVGIGDVRDELHKEYLLLGDQDLIKNNYNVHNQFLEILVESGIVGLILFFLILIIMSLIAYRDRNLLLALFLFIIIIFFMFETVLYRLAGVAFFSLIPFLLIYNQKKS